MKRIVLRVESRLPMLVSVKSENNEEEKRVDMEVLITG